MAEKSGFYGDVSQAVVGNVKEAPRQSNVVNFTIGSKPEFQPLTKLQRQDVTAKVKALVALSGAPALDVYRVLLNNFGAANMNAFPGDKYMAAMALLNARIVALQNVPEPMPAPVGPGAPATPPHQETAHRTMPCSVCVRHAAEMKRMWATVLVLCVLLLASALLCGWLLLPSAVGAAPGSSTEKQCFVDGKAYSLGSSSRMPNGSIRECVSNVSDGIPRWSAGTRK